MWNAVGEYAAWHQIITSPLQCCQMFANELGERHGINVAVEPRFMEVGFGAWEGLSHDEVKIDRADEYLAFLKDPVNHRPHGAEPLDDFIQRISSAYEETIEHYCGSHFLIVAHAGVMPAIIAKTVHATPVGLYRINISNGGITRIRHTKTGSVLDLVYGMVSV